MKKSLRVLVVLSIAASSILFATPSQAAVIGTYYPSGPQRNVPISTITSGGWTLCWSSLFSATDTLVNIESSCTGNYLLEAGGVAGASSYLLAAAGERSSVLGVTSQNQTNLNNGTYWYYYKGSGGMMGGGSMGFSPISTIFQNSADCYYNGAQNCGFSSAIVEGQDPTVDLRMSWHTNSTSIIGGWRIGRLTSLSTSHVRAIYQSNAISSAPDAPTSVTATSTGATTANVSFTAPTSNGGTTITSYTATSSPGGITGSISQAGSGTIAMTGLTAGTAYTFTVTATNSAGTSAASTASNSVTTVGAPTAPTSVVATLTGKRNATVSFAVPASNGGSAVTSYTATSTPGGITQTLTQATGGIFNFDGLQPNTSYTYAVTATNTLGTSTAAISNSIKTIAADIASLSSLTFTNDGTGTAGKLAWAGKNVDLIRYAGDKSSYPYPFNYSAYTPTYDGTSSTWDGSLINLLPGTKYSATIYALSSEGEGESKTIEFTTTTVTAPAKVKSIVAKATGNRSAIVTFTSPEDDGNSPITSYKVVGSPGNKSQTLSQASGASLTFSDLEPETDYTFSVTAINKIGSSVPVLSNSVTTTALVIPSIDNISFTDDGSGTGGAIKWTGKNIASVKFLGSANNYPVNLSYGEYSTSWNGRVRNLTPDIEMTFSISVMSEDGVQVTKSITFKTGPSLVNKISNFLLKNAPLLKEGFQSDEIIVANQIPTIYNLIDLNATFRGESVNIKSLLSKFNNTKVYKQSAYLRLPTARPLNTKALSQSPQVCTVENQNIVRSIAPGYCVIAFTVTGLSQEPATLVKSFEFLKYAKI